MIDLNKENWRWFFGIEEQEGGDYMKLYKVFKWFVLLCAILILAVVYTNHQDIRIEATTNPCLWVDGRYRLCHHNPAQTVDLGFNNYNSCENHLGTPHNSETYDTAGYCPVATSTPTPTNTPVPTVTNTPVPTLTPTVEPTSTPVPTVTPTDEPEPTNEPEPTRKPTKEPTPTGAPCTGKDCTPPSFDQPQYSPAVCTQGLPKVASNPQYSKLNGGVKITWEHDGTNLSKWSLNFGYDRHNMFMGIPKIQKEAREVTIFGLQNKTTWVSICAYNGNDCQACVVFDP